MALLSRRREHDWPLVRLDDVFSDMLERFFEPGRFPVQGEWLPALDVTEREDAIVVRAEAPGMKSADIEVTVQGNTLTISGEKKEQFQDKGKTYHRTERRYGNFHREIPLSSDVEADKIEAVCHDGVLTITLPKSPQAKSRKIQIKQA
jgi:HSP20 family protein